MTRTLVVWMLFGVVAGAVGGACGDDAPPTGGGGGGAQGGGAGVGVQVTSPPFGEPWDTLGDWNLFEDASAQVPAARVVPFEVISPLFSDYAHKWRFLYLPEGTTIGYSDAGAWEFPVGAVLVKTFGYLDDPADPSGGRNLLETRLLWHEPDGWTAHTYVYEEGDAEATREVAGRRIATTFTRPDGATQTVDYAVPNTNQCKECHRGAADAVRHLGPRTRQLDTDRLYGDVVANQIDHLFSIGYLDREPAPFGQRARLVDPFAASSDLSLRARSYLDANCSHCHSDDGVASTSALRLAFDLTDPAGGNKTNWGACVVPTSCGCCADQEMDVVPGSAEASIMACRLAAAEDEQRMPPVGGIVHDEGVELISAWIDAMPIDPDCPPQ